MSKRITFSLKAERWRQILSLEARCFTLKKQQTSNSTALTLSLLFPTSRLLGSWTLTQWDLRVTRWMEKSGQRAVSLSSRRSSVNSRGWVSASSSRSLQEIQAVSQVQYTTQRVWWAGSSWNRLSSRSLRANFNKTDLPRLSTKTISTATWRSSIAALHARIVTIKI